MADQIQDLDPNVPVGTDPVSEGDEIFREIKLAVLNSLPGMTDAWCAELQDIFFRDGDFRTLTISDQILESPQVAIALFGFDGSDGTVVGGGYGVIAGERADVGVYAFTIEDAFSADAQIVVCGSAAVLTSTLVMGGSGVDFGGEIITIQTKNADNGELIDAGVGTVLVFDAERDPQP